MNDVTLVGPIERYMVEDHTRIDRSLRAALPASGRIDVAAYERFRGELLHHIAMEEKVLLPLARDHRGGVALPIAEALRRDHGQIARILARTPTPGLLADLEELLVRHDALEEGAHGLYAQCDALAAADADAWVARLRAVPPVPLATPRLAG